MLLFLQMQIRMISIRENKRFGVGLSLWGAAKSDLLGSFMQYTNNVQCSAALLVACLAIMPAQAQERDAGLTQEAMTLGEVKITGAGENTQDLTTEGTGSYRGAGARAAFAAAVPLREVPQAVSVVTRAQIEDFALNDVNAVLENATGVSVERVETDRFYYTSRGFDITNFQMDGVGMPLADGNISGDVDTALYDRVEITRGANGLMSGAGNPSATVNLVRKRPTQQLQASVKQSLGSWDYERIEGDVSGPLNASGSIRGRLVFANQDSDSYLDRYHKNKSLVYGVIEADVTDRTVLTLGRTRQVNNVDSPMWGGLPLIDVNGRKVDYEVSDSASPAWSYWDSVDVNSFVELAQQFASGWEGKAVLTQTKHQEDARLAYLLDAGWDSESGVGLGVYGSKYDEDNESLTADIYASGPFELAGRQHDLMFGAAWGETQVDNFSFAVVDMLPAVTDISKFMETYKEPDLFATERGAGDYTDEQTAIYGGARFSASDALSLIAGARVTRWETRGESYSLDKSTKHDDVVTPYAGVVYDLNPQWSVYASYSETFAQQTETDINDERVGPVEGEAQEAGLKADLMDGKLFLGLAGFKIEQNNLAVATGDVSASGNQAFRGAEGITSQGAELDIAGQVSDKLQVSLGYSQLSIDGDEVVKAYTPEQLLKASVRYRALDRLKLGASVNWRDAIQREIKGVTVKQDAYALVNLMAQYDISDRFSGMVNINNVTDEQYLSSLYWEQSYFAAPRHVYASLKWEY